MLEFPPQLTPVLDRLLPPVVFLLFVWFGLGWLLPKLWVGSEYVWWTLTLGKTRTALALRGYALQDARLCIASQEVDHGAARPLAVVLALLGRLRDWVGINRELRKIMQEKTEVRFKTYVENLNSAWRSGMPPPVLQDYVEELRSSAKMIKDANLKHRGLCSAANVTYLLGDLAEGNRLAKANWRSAQDQEPELESQLKWMASYAYFNSTLFLGDFREAMSLMRDHWRNYYARLATEEKRKLVVRFGEGLTLNPIVSIPRHMILGAALSGEPALERMFWPSDSQFSDLPPQSRSNEVVWVKSWQTEAETVASYERNSTNTTISLDFTAAYVAFYYTLMLTDSQMGEGGSRARIAAQAREQLERIDDDAPLVSRYAKFAFLGAYHLVEGEDAEALSCLRMADQYSSISGNRFLDCLVKCWHAVAAARRGPFLEPEVKFYLGEAKAISAKLDRVFFTDLYRRAEGAVAHARGAYKQAERKTLRSENGRAKGRILKIFESRGGGRTS